jgi:hypothetical protein
MQHTDLLSKQGEKNMSILNFVYVGISQRCLYQVKSLRHVKIELHRSRRLQNVTNWLFL